MAFSSGTTTLVTGTETTLGNINTPGEFYLVVDLANMAAGDVTEVRSYQTVLASGTSRVADFAMYAGAQPTDNMLYVSNRYVNDLTEKDSVKFTLKQTFGTGRAYNWKILQVGPPNFYMQAINVTGAVTVADAGAGLTAVLDRVEFQRAEHTVVGSTYYVDGVGGNDTTGTGSRLLPFKTISRAHTACVSNAHDCIVLLPNVNGGPTTITESSPIILSKNYVQVRGPGRDVRVTLNTTGTVFSINGNGIELSGMQIVTASGTTSDGVNVNNGSDFAKIYRCWIENCHQDAIQLNVANNCFIVENQITSPARDGIRVESGAGSGQLNKILDNLIRDASAGTGISLQGVDASKTRIQRNVIKDCLVGVEIASGVVGTIFTDNRFANNGTNFTDAGTNTNHQWNFLDTSSVGYVTAGINTGTFIEAISDVVWDEQTSAHQIVGSTGKALTSAGSAGDPWSTVIPGAYASGTAGNILGGRLDVFVSSRAASGTSSAIDYSQVWSFTGSRSLNGLQSWDRIGNTSGTLTNVYNVVSGTSASIDYSQVWSFTGSRALNGQQNWNLTGNISGTISNVANPVVASAVQGGTVTVSGTVVVGTNNDKTGYSLVNNQVINFSGTITNVVNVINPVTVGTNNDKTGYSLSSPQTFTLIGNISGTHVGNQIGNIQGSVANVTGSVGGVVGLTPSLLDVAVSSRMASGTVVVGTNNDKTNYQLANNQVVNFSGTITNVVNVINPVTAGTVTGTVTVAGLNTALIDVAISSRMASGTVVVATNNDKTGYSLSSLQNFNLIGNISGTIQGNLNGYVGRVTGSVMSLVSGSQATVDYSQVWSFSGSRSLNGNQTWNVSGTFTNVYNVINQVSVSGSTAGDPWGTAVPGAYGAGTAGYILGNNLDATVSSRLSSGTFASNYVTPPTAGQNAAAVISAATATPIDSNVQKVNDVTLKGDGSTTPWGPV